MIVANIIALSIAAVFTTTIFVAYIKAEKKLAKHGESTLFSVKNDKANQD